MSVIRLTSAAQGKHEMEGGAAFEAVFRGGFVVDPGEVRFACTGEPIPM